MAFSQKDFEKIETLVLQIPIEKIVFSDAKYVRTSGPHMLGLCPFHDDHVAGSFKVTPGRKNMWKCWSCEHGGVGGVSFYSQFHNLNYQDSIIALAEKYHCISEADKIQYYQDKEAPLSENHFQATLIPQKIPNKKLNPDKLDMVYSAFIESSPKMTEEMETFLKEDRYLSNAEMSDFFMIPSNGKMFWQKFLANLKRRDLSAKECLIHTPGFYTTKPTGLFSFPNEAGNLGIIEHDSCGRINGIQVRRQQDCAKYKRYSFFSSGFADLENSNIGNGTNIGTTVDVLPGTRPTYLACTEGKFKAIKIQSTFHLYTLNMHGVSSWPASEVARIAAAQNKTTVLLFYDADIQTNDSVAKAAIRFTKAILSKGLNVEFVVWDIALGKGIDDMINAGHKNKLKRKDANWFINNVLQPLVESKKKI